VNAKALTICSTVGSIRGRSSAYDGRVNKAQLVIEGTEQQDDPAEWADAWRRHLTGPQDLPLDGAPGLGIADLFSGIGGLALGFMRAASDEGIGCRSVFASDLDERALAVYSHNLGTQICSSRSAANLVDFQVRGQGGSSRFPYVPELVGDEIAALRGSVDVVLAGPPCQGHSTLNNRTRGDDPRNRLYLTVPAFAVAVGARAVIIENVPGVTRSRGNVVETAITLLEDNGYYVSPHLLVADRLGWPQTRKRYFLVAVRDAPPEPLQQVAERFRRRALPVSWAIGDLLDREINARDPLHVTADLSAENAERIAWLFENEEHETPNHLRPECHRDGTTYGAVYGRMWWDRPSPTLTTGFFTPGRGRFVHPLQPRTLTAREAARIQGFPDWYDFSAGGALSPVKKDLSKWIGNAVPAVLGYAAAASVLPMLVKS
jgi:DNA (cytosine-5)-methyltransferase 1